MHTFEIYVYTSFVHLSTFHSFVCRKHKWPYQLSNKWEIILLLLRKLAIVEYYGKNQCRIYFCIKFCPKYNSTTALLVFSKEAILFLIYLLADKANYLIKTRASCFLTWCKIIPTPCDWKHILGPLILGKLALHFISFMLMLA